MVQNLFQISIFNKIFLKAVLCPLILCFTIISCVPQQTDNTPLDLHDIYFYDGTGGIRYSMFYGEARNFDTNGQTLSLTSNLTSDATKVSPLSFPEALYVNNLPFLETTLEKRPEAAFTATRSRFTSDLNFTANEQLNEVVYYDGFFWFTLATDVNDNIDAVLTPKRRFQKLEGFGQLTASEALALSNYYESLGDSLVIGLLPPSTLDDDSNPPNPRATGFENYRETQIYIQKGIPLNDTLVSTAVERIRLDLLASGNVEAVDRLVNTYEIATNDADYTSVWNIAYAKVLDPPAKPNLNLNRETILGIFLSSRTDTDYSLDIVDAVEESGELYLDVNLVDNTNTQPLFSTSDTNSETIYNPWAIVRILQANIPVIWIRDANSGDLLGVARR